MLRELGRRAVLGFAVAMLLFAANPVASQTPDALQTWRFHVEGMT